jgi:hypothetical protein
MLCRLVASQFYCWRSFAAQQQQQRQAAEAAAAVHCSSLLTRAWSGWRQQADLAARLRARLQDRQQLLLRQALCGWWEEAVGAKRAFDFQVLRGVQSYCANFLRIWRAAWLRSELTVCGGLPLRILYTCQHTATITAKARHSYHALGGGTCCNCHMWLLQSMHRL